MRKSLPSYFEDVEIQPDVFMANGQTRYYHRQQSMGIDQIQFYKKAKNGKYVKASDVIPYKFYKYIWEHILDLGKWGGTGSDIWYECVDLICDDKERFEMAWMMYTLEGNNDELKRKQAHKKKSPAKRR